MGVGGWTAARAHEGARSRVHFLQHVQLCLLIRGLCVCVCRDWDGYGMGLG